MKICGKKMEVSAMSKINKGTKLAVLSLLGILALAGCSESSSTIKSKPSNYNDPIITIDGYDEKIHNDLLSIIYDQMEENSVPSKTLEAVLYRYAQSVYGSYNKVSLAKSEEGATTLKAAAANAKEVDENLEDEFDVDYTVVNEFIKKHKSYWTYNAEGKHINDDDPENVYEVDEKNYTPSAHERQNVASKWDDIEDRIAENIYLKAVSANTSKHRFNEVSYVKSLYFDKQDVDYAEAKRVNQAGDPVYPSVIIPYTLEQKDIFNDGYMHREFYQTNYGIGEDETADVQGKQFHYVEKEIIPTVYGDLLIEQYLLDEELPAVRTSRARLINVIKIEKYSTFTLNADLLVNKLVDEIYSSRPHVRADKDPQNPSESLKHYIDYVDEEHNPIEALFERYEKLAKGLYNDLSGDDIALLAAINSGSSDVFELVDDGTSNKPYYKHTTYGDLVEEYEKLLKMGTQGYEAFDSTLYNKYTSDGTRTIEEGFDQSELDIAQSKSITKGWYVQKSGPSLDSTITDSLFKNQIANYKIEAYDQYDEVLEADWVPVNEDDPSEGKEIKGKLARADRIMFDDETKEWVVRSEPSEDEGTDLCSINGAFFLKFGGQYSEDDYKKDIVYDDGSAYYIVQVVEAAKDTKLRNASSANSYANSRGQKFLNEVIAQITRKVAETGNYSSLAKEHWLKEMSIKYHDQEVYDYFKDNYPDLFD